MCTVYRVLDGVAAVAQNSRLADSHKAKRTHLSVPRMPCDDANCQRCLIISHAEQIEVVSSVSQSLCRAAAAGVPCDC